MGGIFLCVTWSKPWCFFIRYDHPLMGKSPMSNGTSAGRFLEKVGHPQVMGFPVLDFGEYPLVNLQKTMENHHFS